MSQLKNDSETQLLTAENYYLALRSLSDAIVCISNHHKISFFNSAAEKLFGISSQEAVGQHIDIILPQAYRRTHHLYLRNFLDKQAINMAGRVFRLKLLCQAGRQFPATLSVSHCHVQEGDLLVILVRRRLASTVLPITEYTSNFMGTSIASICHEIRNPLVSIGGFARRVGHDPGLNEHSYAMLDIIQEEVGRLERLVNNLNDLSKAPNYHYEYVNIATLTKHVIDIMNQQAGEEEKTIVMHSASRPPLLWLDKDKISQVLINILRNSLQASQAGAGVKVEIGMSDKPGFALLSIIDQGKGVPPEQLPNLFKPFFTTTQGGTGLGLAMSRRIIEDHGGYIAIKSQFNQGTSVFIYLPLHPVDPVDL